MNSHLFDHIDLRVSNIGRARRLYDAFLPALGLTEIEVDPGFISYQAPGDKQRSPFVGLDEKPDHRGNANRIAFWVDTEEEVNRLGEIVRAAGAQVIEGPEYCAEYKPGYYAVFFEDEDGNKWEVCCRCARVR
jgi:catechol 2,3-dioxygenase-like lactoylglutathione lyase family enzyme